MSSEEESSKLEIDTERDHADELCKVQTYLKRASDEYKETCELHAILSKQFQRRRSTDSKEETADESRRVAELTKKRNQLFEELVKLRRLVGIWSYLITVRRIGDTATSTSPKATTESAAWQNFILKLTNELESGQLLQSSLFNRSSFIHLSSWIDNHFPAWRTFSSTHISSLIADHLERAELPQNALHADKRLLDKIRPLAQALLDISSSLSVAANSADEATTTTTRTEASSSFESVAEALLRPFVKRFFHHFYNGGADQRGNGGGTTKSIVIKPEWYLSIVIKWHRQFTPWIDSMDLDEGKGKRKAAVDDSETRGGEDDGEDEPPMMGPLAVIFSRGLVKLARNRFKVDLLQYAQEDTGALPHLIDEGISFDSDMKAAGYPEDEIGCVDILTEPGVFELWAQLEQQEASKCLDAFFNDPEAWLLRYGDNSLLADSNVDAQKVPIITDNLLVLLSAMNHRFRFVRSPEYRRMFIQSQCTLLHDFRQRLSELCQDLCSPIAAPLSTATTKTQEQRSSPTFAPLVNTCSYICSVLSEWQETPSYWSAVRPGCFKDIIDLFDYTKRILFRDACSAVLRDLQPSVDEYRRSFGLFTGRGDVTFAGQATPFLYDPIREAISVLRRTLNGKNFYAFARQLTSGLEKKLIERVVLELRLDQKSGEELQRHLGATFIKIITAQCGENNAASAANYCCFDRLNEYLHVASMNAGNCTLLKEALRERRLPVEQVMNEMGLKHITAQEVEELLQRRSDLM